MPLSLFAFTLFFSAALMFSVQPMLGKMLLPRFGGSPAVWNTCLVFFQAMLLAGYGYAHALGRLDLRRQVRRHVSWLLFGLVLSPLLTWPFGIGEELTSSGGDFPVLRLLLLLLMSVGVPFFAIAATAPLLQRWFASADPADGRDPYVLYAASNLGSMIALLSYPVLVEPYISLPVQSWIWVSGYLLLIAPISYCALLCWSSPSASYPELFTPPPEPPPSHAQRFRWLALAFVPSSLLYGVTTFLSTDVAPVPLIWVVPLALYLLTFILVFAPVRVLKHSTVLLALPLIVLGQTFVLAIQDMRPRWLLFALHLLTFFVTALACHGELARQKPPPERLTAFYLWLSLGGVLGGLFNVLAAPLLFNSLIEYPLAFVLACFVVPAAQVTPGGVQVSESAGKRIVWNDVWLPLILYLLLSSLVPIVKTRVESLPLQVGLLYALPAAVCYYAFVGRPLRFGLGVGAMLLAGASYSEAPESKLVHQERNFFGVLKVVDAHDDSEPPVVIRTFQHGRTVHGRQRLDADPAVRREPLSYYFRNGPIGELFAALADKEKPKKIAVLGLGAGTLASYAERGQEWTFYEIGPAVARIAEDYFTYLQDARDRGARVRVVQGDARLMLAQSTERYDIIFVDAFSSDAVPVHLLTREAVKLYDDCSHFNFGNGLLVFNVTNRYLDLEPVLATVDWNGSRIREESKADISTEDLKNGKDASRWVLYWGKGRAPLYGNLRWRELRRREGMRPWTDDFSNVFGVFGWE